jgi:heme-degrading monooxygenase HmoA
MRCTANRRLTKSVTAIAKRVLPVAMLAGALMGFSMGTSYRAVDTSRPKPDAEVIVVITEVRLGADSSARAEFWRQVWAVESALPKQPGLVGYALRREVFGTTAWTMTLWRDEDSIRAFIRSAIHSKAMQNGLPATINTRFVRFRRPWNVGPPGWVEAIDQLKRNGRGY